MYNQRPSYGLPARLTPRTNRRQALNYQAWAVASEERGGSGYRAWPRAAQLTSGALDVGIISLARDIMQVREIAALGP